MVYIEFNDDYDIVHWLEDGDEEFQWITYYN